MQTFEPGQTATPEAQAALAQRLAPCNRHWPTEARFGLTFPAVTEHIRIARFGGESGRRCSTRSRSYDTWGWRDHTPHATDTEWRGPYKWLCSEERLDSLGRHWRRTFEAVTNDFGDLVEVPA